MTLVKRPHNYPGRSRKKFKVQLSDNWFRRRDILTNGHETLKVIKVYDRVWWRRVLRYLGFKIKYCNKIKVKSL